MNCEYELCCKVSLIRTFLINLFVFSLRESGILSYWATQTTTPLTPQIRSFFHSDHFEHHHHAPLTLLNVSGVFYQLMIGLILGGLVFAVEIYV